MGSIVPSQCGRWTEGSTLCPLIERMTTQPSTRLSSATNRRSRAMRWRSRARETSALPRMDVSDDARHGLAGPCPIREGGATREGRARQADS